jgi:trans-aconitate methyltransferase
VSEKPIEQKPAERWGGSDAYERYVGRWSRQVAPEFLRWLDAGRGLAWADVGCGTGALSEAILADHAPASIEGVDAAEGFLARARERLADPRVRVVQGDAKRLRWDPRAFDVAVSGLVLNFVGDHEAMAREMARVTRPGGRVALYVWDYAGEMQMTRYFWEAAIAVSPGDAKLSQAERFPICRPEPLRALFEGAGLRAVETRAIDIPTVFCDFDDYWSPFLGRQGSAPTYLASVDEGVRERIRGVLEKRLAPAGGPIRLMARAWAVRGDVAP